MIYCIYFSLIFFNLIWGLKKLFYPLNRLPGNKNIILVVLSVLGCYILIAGYRNTSGLSNDLSNSAYEFKQVISGVGSRYEVGYVSLLKAGARFTQNYYIWRQITAFIFVLIFFIIVYKLVDNAHFVYAMFSAYLMILSAEQFRNFMALVLFSIGILILVNSQFPKKKIVFIICTLLASTIHSIFLIYLLLIFADKTFSPKAVKRIAIVVLLVCLIIFLNGNNVPGLSLILNYFAGNRFAVYLTQKTRLGFLYPMVMHLSSVLISFYIMKKSNNKKYELIFKINTIMMVCFPLYMLQTSFYRIARNILLLTYVAEGDSILSVEIKLKNKLFIVLISILALLLWFYIDLYITTPKEALLLPFFETNEFLL